MVDRDVFQRLRRIALELADARSEDRSELLDRSCGDDAELRAEVLRLLEHDEGESSLDDPAGRSEVIGELAPLLLDALNEAAAPSDPELVPGDRVGHFRIIREIGRGGMAAVFLAERDDRQFEQRVALKLLHIAGRREIVSRFEQERQILASLSHPNIARLLDGGVTDANQPYIVMEYVEGSRIDAYCDAEELSIRERIELFLVVIRAVRHAHQKLVVHRDLKPSNIFVTATGDVKLLDFGIAKLLDRAPYAHAAPPTRTSVRLMTPEYASPEQVRGEAVGIASDVYQLGLLLYELLTGHNPQRDVAESAAALERSVTETEPPRASSTALTSADAKVRRTTPSRLRKLLRGDIDNIIAKALQRKLERRYESTDQLLDDLERHLDGRPVSARPDTFGYRSGRFVKRHRVGVTVAAGFLGLLGAYVVTLTLQADRIARERDRARAEATKAEEIKDFLVDLFKGADPWYAQGEELTARQLLDRGADRIDEELAEEPKLRAEIGGVVGDIYRALGLLDEAKPLLERSAETILREYGPDAPQTARSWLFLAMLEYERGEYEQAERHAREALSICTRTLEETDPSTSEAMKVLAVVLVGQGRYDEAETFYRRAIALRRKEGPGAEGRVAECLSSLSNVLSRRDDVEGAEEMAREALAIRRKINGPESIEYTTTLNNLALLLAKKGDLEEAQASMREAVEVGRHALGEDHPLTALRMANLARMLRGPENQAEKESLYKEALRIREASLPAGHPMIAAAYNDLGLCLQDGGDLAAAEPLYREAIERMATGYGTDHPWFPFMLYNLGSLLRARGELAEASRLLDESIDFDRKIVGDDHPRIAATLVELADVERERGRTGAAEAAYREALELVSRRQPPDSAEIADLQSRLNDLGKR